MKGLGLWCSLLLGSMTLLCACSARDHSAEVIVIGNGEDEEVENPKEFRDIESSSLSYTAAYEFNDPQNLGKDYFGLNNAEIGKGTPMGDGENLVLDGHSGLKIPLSKTFETNAFFIEARIYPEAFDDMQNIIVSEPPGGFYGGWQLRLDNGSLKFHIRDYEEDGSTWTIFDAGTLPLDKWSYIFVEKFSSGRVLIWINEVIALSDFYPGNIINYNYDLGIGYDAMQQSEHTNRFFVGKIDYIRFGRGAE